MVTHTGPLLSYAASEGGIARIRGVLPPLIAVPTASGSGTEVARSGAIVFSDGRRLQLVSPYLIPRVAICDPVLTLGTPPEATAQGGMDALTHCIETYVATGYNPPADAIALDGVRRASTNLRRAVDDGSDLEARREMMAAAIEGALALQKGLGSVHAMSFALEGLQTSGPAHGALNAILLPTRAGLQRAGGGASVRRPRIRGGGRPASRPARRDPAARGGGRAAAAAERSRPR